MLKSLRRRFLFNNLFLVTIVIAIFFGGLFFVSYEYERQQSVRVLSLVLDNLIDVPGSIILDEEGVVMAVQEEDTLSRLRAVIFLAQTDEEGNITAFAKEESAQLPENFADKVVGTALRDTDLHGTTSVDGTLYRYMKMPNRMSGYKIAVSDASTEAVTLRFMMRMYLFAALFLFAIMFIISKYMSHRAIAPVEKSWNNQNRFVADASHELKTPLTIILANMDIMESNPNATIAEQRKWIENTKSEAKRMTELINDMLFLARGDAAVEQNFEFADINVSSLVEDCILTFEAVAFEKGVKLVAEISPDVRICADELKLKQAVIILIDNAIKYANEGGVVALSLKSVSRHTVRIAVLNSGSPIPKEKQKHVFDRFYRADESRARNKGGYGLGLSIASHIVEVHRGRIALDFSDERGTCFSITLPMKHFSGVQFRGIKRKHS